MSYSYDRCFTFYESKIPSLVVNCNVAFESFARSTIGKLSFGPNVTYIEEQGFCYSSITGTVDLSNITYIGANAFYDCSAVEKFIFGNNPTTVKEQSFYNCANAEFEFNGYVNLDMDSAYAFAGCKKLKNLPPFRPQTEITDGIFEDCISIEELNLTNVYAFARAFGGCTNVSSIVGLDTPIMEFDEELGVIYMNNEFDERCYLVVGFEKLIPENLEIPSKVDVIAGKSFAGCTNLKNIYIYDDEFKVRNIQAGAFENCVNLESFSLGYCEIGKSSFKGCSSLKEIQINSQEIGAYAFADCTALEKITFTAYTNILILGPSIGGYIFSGCTAIKEIHDYMFWKGSGTCSKYFWTDCGKPEHYYAYYCDSSSSKYNFSYKQRDIKDYGTADAFPDIIEYKALTPEEWSSLTW